MVHPGRSRPMTEMLNSSRRSSFGLAERHRDVEALADGQTEERRLDDADDLDAGGRRS